MLRVVGVSGGGVVSDRASGGGVVREVGSASRSTGRSMIVKLSLGRLNGPGPAGMSRPRGPSSPGAKCGDEPKAGGRERHDQNLTRKPDVAAITLLYDGPSSLS